MSMLEGALATDPRTPNCIIDALVGRVHESTQASLVADLVVHPNRTTTSEHLSIALFGTLGEVMARPNITAAGRRAALHAAGPRAVANWLERTPGAHPDATTYLSQNLSPKEHYASARIVATYPTATKDAVATALRDAVTRQDTDQCWVGPVAARHPELLAELEARCVDGPFATRLGIYREVHAAAGDPVPVAVHDLLDTTGDRTAPVRLCADPTSADRLLNTPLNHHLQAVRDSPALAHTGAGLRVLVHDLTGTLPTAEDAPINLDEALLRSFGNGADLYLAADHVLVASAHVQCAWLRAAARPNTHPNWLTVIHLGLLPEASPELIELAVQALPAAPSPFDRPDHPLRCAQALLMRRSQDLDGDLLGNVPLPDLDKLASIERSLRAALCSHLGASLVADHDQLSDPQVLRAALALADDFPGSVHELVATAAAITT